MPAILSSSLLVNLAALSALVPLTGLAVGRAMHGGTGGPMRRNGLFWTLLAVAAAGPVLVLAWGGASAAWGTGFSTALWLTVGACLVAFAALSAVSRQGWRLAVLLLPYLLLLACLATIWHAAPGRPLALAPPAAWLTVHIVASLLTYALITLAAVSGLAVILQERALKRRRAPPALEALPPVADAERLEVRLLGLAEVVLGAGLATGMALSYLNRGVLLTADHKTVLSLAAFALIGVLLAARYRSGVRGRRAARLVLAAYLLVTLAYPGVKFVTDVLAG